MPLCLHAKFGYDKEIDAQFGYNRRGALRALAKKDFPPIAQVLTKTHMRAFNQPMSEPSAAVHGSSSMLPLLRPSNSTLVSAATPAITTTSPWQQPNQATNGASNVTPASDLGHVRAGDVVVRGDTEFPRICPCCGSAGTTQCKILVEYRKPHERLLNVLGLVALLGGGFVRLGSRSAYLRPWVCERCPRRKRVLASIAMVARLVSGAAAVWIVGSALLGPTELSGWSLLAVRPIGALVVCVVVNVLSERTKLLQAGRMDKSSVTLVRTHANFRAAMQMQP
jgi:hypothetical protein